jgi:Ca2+:H+ antiporter
LLTFARLILGWGTVAAFLLFSPFLLGDLSSSLYAALLFVGLVIVILWSAFSVVGEADHLAEMLGEPLGTLILTLSIVLIEVVLISAVMLGEKQVATLGRDTMFAVLMIVLNGVVGLGLLIGGLRHHEQSYNLQGAGAYFAVIIPLSIIIFVLPNFTISTPGGTLTIAQEIAFSVFTLVLYGIFLLVQTGRHRGFFVDPGFDPAKPRNAHEVPTATAIGKHTGLLLISVLPIVLLAKKLAVLIDHELDVLAAPPILGGVLIAMVVFAPEGISALRAVTSNQLQRGINLCLGAAASTIGLTVPAIVAISVLSKQTIVLGLAPAQMVLLATTLLLSTLTFSRTRTTLLEGAMHLVVFFVYVTLIFSP